MTAKSIFGTEAEEILRKQLAIEQEVSLKRENCGFFLTVYFDFF